MFRWNSLQWNTTLENIITCPSVETTEGRLATTENVQAANLRWECRERIPKFKNGEAVVPCRVRSISHKWNEYRSTGVAVDPTIL